ncbi:HK97-gp10 family putative phage morphogenesis protein [Pseudobacillus sp. 179-B 2D1 NHS]|uniref:HK97-gp10 family putative phage morphogenesis protein n=1 Tax=Pseudobacillus sp. 179-B 2D1 NHS TaxID=3374292 RepID=UPI003879A9F1
MRFENHFDRVREEIQKNVERSLEAIGQYVKGESKLRAPVGEYKNGRVGGRLRDSINHKVDINSKSVQIGTDVEYGVYVEKGTYKMNAQPYLTPAAEENLDNIQRILENHFENLDS